MVAHHTPAGTPPPTAKLPKHRGLQYGMKLFPNDSDKPAIYVKVYKATAKSVACAVVVNGEVASCVLVAKDGKGFDAFDAFMRCAEAHGFAFAPTQDDDHTQEPLRRVVKAVKAMAGAMGIHYYHMVQMHP